MTKLEPENFRKFAQKQACTDRLVIENIELDFPDWKEYVKQSSPEARTFMDKE